MAKQSRLLTSSSKLMSDRGGNFAIMAAIVIPVLFAFGGVALDMTNMVLTKNQLQAATDAAALAASSGLANDGLTQTQAKLTATEFLKAQMKNQSSTSLTPEELAALDSALSDKTTINITEQKAAVGNARTYTVAVATKIDLPLSALTQLLGRKKTEIGAMSRSYSSTEAQNALSMFLVLDRSGSMKWKTNAVDKSATSCYIYEESYWPKAKWSTPCYIYKIASLKVAVTNLLTQMSMADPTSLYVRTAAVSYSSQKDTTGALDWGTTKTMTYVDALSAEGGTDSSGGFAAALQALTAPSENNAHLIKNGQTEPKKFIVFMTDGDNNYYKGVSDNTADEKSDLATKSSCDSARTNKVEVYTVAFMAPSRGQNLLKYCATDTTHYFQAQDSAALVAAFKEIGEKASKLTVRLTQ